MASNIFNDANGTTLAAKDPKWIGNTTLLEMQGGELQVTNASLFNDRFVAYSDGQPNAHESEVELAAGCSFAGGEILEVTCQYTSASVLYSARVGTTDVVLRRNGSYVDASAHGMNLAVAGNKVRIACDPATGSVQIYINNTLLGIAPYTDGSPLTGGLPGFYINVQGNAATTIRLLSWSDGIAGGAPAALDSRGSLRPTRVPQRRPGRGPYSMGTYRRPSLDVFGPLVQPLFGEAVGQGSAAGSLDHGVPLAGTAQGGAAATGTLSHGVPLAGAAQGGGTAAGTLSHDVPLAGAAQGQAAATGTLSQSTPLAGAAQGGATASGTLDQATAPVDALFASTRNRPGRGPYSKGRYYRAPVVAFISKVADLSGNASVQATAAAALQLLVNLAAAGVGGGTASAALAKAVQLAGAAAGAAGAAGQLAVSVLLNGAANGGGSATGSLSTNGSVDLAGNAVGGGLATGNLQLTVSLVGAALGTANASGTLLGSVPLNGAAVALATSTGQLALSIALSGAALAQATSSASFAGVVTLGGSAATQAGVSGSLFLTVPLSAAAQALAAASGGLVVTVLLGGSASASSSATAALQKAVLLSGAAGGQANATGTMTVGGLSVSTERAYRARCVPRRWTARAASRGASA